MITIPYSTRNPYATNRDLYECDGIDLEYGINVLVGCNGYGKTTCLKEIKNYLDRNKMECVYVDNYKDGGISAMDYYLNVANDVQRLMYSMCSSEGERIKIFLGKFFLELGRKARQNEDIFFLLDACDSGFSIDNIDELKVTLQKRVLKDKRNMYIVISTNSYEFARNERCVDVVHNKCLKFSDYEEYRKFVLETRKIKTDRYV